MLLLGGDQLGADAWLVDNDGDVEMVSPTEESVRLSEALMAGAAASSTPEGTQADLRTPDSTEKGDSLLPREEQGDEKGEKSKNSKRAPPMIPPRSYRGIRRKLTFSSVLVF